MKPSLPSRTRTVPVIEPTAATLPVVVLGESETITIVTSDGQPLLEIGCNSRGPAIRLKRDHLRVECPGRLDFAAQAIHLDAVEDVTVKGRTIRLN